jgi:hypothetical protein
MVLNIIIGFIIPWIFGIWLYRKNKNIVLFIAPIACALSCVVDILGFDLDFWRLVPIKLLGLSALPFNLGLYIVYPCFTVYWLERTSLNHFLALLISSLVITIAEYMGVIAGRVIYLNGWHIWFTYLSYLIPYCLLYCYYRIIKQYVSI